MKFADNINEQNKKIDLLFGDEYYHKFFIEEIIRGKEGEPVAQNTYFGWVLGGNISTFDCKNPSFVTSMQINTSPVLNLSTEFENEVFKNEPLGILEHHTKNSHTKMMILLKMRKFLQFKKCLAFKNNRYCVNLPLKNHYLIILPDNFNVARSRLISLKRKLNSNPTLLHEYDQIMKDYLKNNTIEEVN